MFLGERVSMSQEAEDVFRIDVPGASQGKM
jgi:hypothetical protein